MIYYLGLGSNIGNRLKNLLEAREYLLYLGIIKASSALYESEPFGVSDQKAFLNAVCVLDSTLRPFRLLRRIKCIECLMGRIRSERWGPRNIDIDIIDWQGPEINTSILRIPHDGLQMRNFIYYPLTDVAPDYKLQDGAPIAGLRDEFRGQQGWIKPYKEIW